MNMSSELELQFGIGQIHDSRYFSIDVTIDVALYVFCYITIQLTISLCHFFRFSVTFFQTHIMFMLFLNPYGKEFSCCGTEIWFIL